MSRFAAKESERFGVFPKSWNIPLIYQVLNVYGLLNAYGKCWYIYHGLNIWKLSLDRNAKNRPVFQEATCQNAS